ncbi:MAG: alpha/beta fold hydrolase [bacterium]
MKRFLFSASIIMAAVLLVGCELFLPTHKPIPCIRLSTTDRDVRERTLLVLLPGRGSRMGDYVEEGFFRLAREAKLPLDVVSVDAHFGYYMRRTLITRLTEDFVGPARQKGYRQIWILGISMGGLGALLYVQQHPKLVDGLILLAPFLGDQDLIDKIVASGGVAAWKPKEPVKKSDYQRQLWRWLKKYVDRQPGLPDIFIGWGRSDRFRKANALLAGLLPPTRQFQAPGGHTYGPWRQLFRRILAAPELRQRMIAPAGAPRSAAPPPNAPARKKQRRTP